VSALSLPALLHAAPVAIVTLDLAGRVLDVNRELLAASGYSIEEMRGVRFDAFIEPAAAEASRARFAALVSGQCEGYRAAARYRTRGGELRDVDVRVTLVRNAEGMPEFCLAALQDVTEHIDALGALRRRAAELESVIESIPAAVYIGDETGIKMANDAALALLGYTDVAELNRHIAELSAQLQNRDASGQPIIWQDEPFARALRGEAVDTEVVSRHQQTGEDVVQRVIAAPVRVEGRVVGAVAVNTNITARRRTEEALRVSEQRYRALVEQAPFSVQILSPDGRTLQVNRAWQQLWGLTLEQLGGYNML
jgi:PAS domain S-box-containing protein